MNKINIDFIKFWDDEIVQGHINNETSIIFEYFKSKNIETINYVDIGANVGKYYDVIIANGFKVNIAIMDEAAPDLYNYMVNKFANKPNCKIYNYAVSDVDGVIKFESHIETYKDRDPNDKSINLGLAKMPHAQSNNSGEGIEVPVITGKSFFENYVNEYKNDINLIKIDTENRDYNILKSITSYINTMQNKPFIILEHNYHNDMSYDEAKTIYNNFKNECKYEGFEFDELHSSVFLTPKK